MGLNFEVEWKLDSGWNGEQKLNNYLNWILKKKKKNGQYPKNPELSPTDI